MNKVKVTYLGKDGKPTSEKNAIIIEHTTYDAQGRPIDSKFGLLKADSSKPRA